MAGNRERTWCDKIRGVLSRLEGFNAPQLGEHRALKCPEWLSVLDEVNYQGASNIIVNPCRELRASDRMRVKSHPYRFIWNTGRITHKRTRMKSKKRSLK